VNEISQIIRQLEQQRTAIERALTALRDFSGGSAPQSAAGRPAGGPGRKPRKRRLSPEGRARIAEAARRRWAALKAGGGQSRSGRKKSA
jgi:hypothetical protein